ncbi:MAG: hypothetical protein R3F59_36835 [Myxococcota bacterium]
MTLGVAVVLAFAPQACTKRLPHGGEDPVYPLRGLHAAVPCEGCHGSGTPKALPTLCIDCHEDDRPEPSHYPGQNCTPCHSEYGWDQIATSLLGTGETGATPTTETGTTTTGGFDHSVLPETQACWDCHEAERKDAEHYYSETKALRWDCGPCHGVKDWAVDTYEHPVHSPHGAISDDVENPEGEWIVACSSCHTNPGDNYTTYDCQTCHSSLITTPPGHYGLTTLSTETNETCIVACHPAGEVL